MTSTLVRLCAAAALALSLARASARAGAMSVRHEAAADRYTIYDGDRPVLTYNFGTVPVPPGVGGKYAVARSDYIHPIHGPAGEVLTLDYSPDHPHHRGVYWAWPEVSYKGRTHDLHALQGVFARPVKIVRKESGDDHAVDHAVDQAVIEAENVWRWEDREAIVAETVAIRAGRWRDGARAIDLSFRFTALVDGVKIARRGRDKYGGLNIRLSARRDQSIVTFTDPAGLRRAQSSRAPARRAWADLCGVPPEGERRIGVAILQHPLNPRYPGDWVQYPDLNWLQPTFPSSGEAFELRRGEPLTLAFRLVVHEGSWGEEELAGAWSAYAVPGEEHFRRLATWRFGESRREQIAVERLLGGTAETAGTAGTVGTTSEARRRIEGHLCALVSDPRATPDAVAWACAQLERIGTAASVPALARLLLDARTCDAACMALRAITGPVGAPKVDAALLDALDHDDRACRAAVIRLLGQRRVARAASPLAGVARTADREIAAAALDALGSVGTPEAARLLTRLSVPPALGPPRAAAMLRCAQHLLDSRRVDAAAALFRGILDGDPPDGQRAAALIGLAKADPASATPVAFGILSDERSSRRLLGAAARLLARAPGDVSARLVEALPDLAPHVRLVVMGLLASRGDASVAPDLARFAASSGGDEQLAAIEALAALGGPAEVETLARIAAGEGAAARKAAEALAILKGDGVNETVHSLARSGPGELRGVLIKCIASRAASGSVDLLVSLARDPDARTCSAACAALGRLAVPEDLGAVLALVKSSEELAPERSRSAVRAVASICLRAADRDACAREVLAALRRARTPVAVEIVGMLPSLGGDLALEAVREHAASGSADVRRAALRALTEWREPSALPDLLSLLETRRADAADPVRVLALRGLVRLSDHESIDTADREKALDAALRSAARPEEKVLVISALGRSRSLHAVERLAALLDDPAVRTEAAMAIATACLAQDRRPQEPPDVYQPRPLETRLLKETLRRARAVLRGRDTKLVARIDAHLAAGANLALGRPATSSRPSEEGHPPAHAVDGKRALTSYWGCHPPPCRLEVDLESVARIGAIRVFTYWDGTRYYQYRIEVSTDRERWREVVDRSANTTPSDAEGATLSVGPVEARYVRVQMLRNSANPGQHIVELEVLEAAEH